MSVTLHRVSTVVHVSTRSSTSLVAVFLVQPEDSVKQVLCMCSQLSRIEMYCSQECHMILTVSIDTMDECMSFPCRNSGRCTDRPGGFQCQCSSGLTGSQCEAGMSLYHM